MININTASSPSLCIVCFSEADRSLATSAATQTGAVLLQQKSDQHELQLCFQHGQASLYCLSLDTSVKVDFRSGKLAHRKRYGGGKQQAIARAIGVNQRTGLHVVDATAGLASDAFVLASLGCKLTLLERSPVLCALIRSAISDASLAADSGISFEQDFHLHQVDSKQFLHDLSETDYPDVIYLDPMYPHRKKSAKVKKEMQVLQQLHGADDNADALLDIALHRVKKRVVVKRPASAAPLAGQLPSAAIKTKNTRFDLYTLASIQS